MISLTTSISLGALDPVPYTHVKILKMLWDAEARRIDLWVRAGYLVNGNFVSGKETGATYKQHQIFDGVIGGDPPTEVTDYTDILETETSGTGNLIYDEVSTALYTWLLAKDLYDGTIVP